MYSPSFVALILILINLDYVAEAMKLRSGSSLIRLMGSTSKSSNTSAGFGSFKGKGAHPLQRIHDLLKEVPDLTKSVSNPEKRPNLLRCVDLMNEVTLEDLGLEKDELHSKLAYSMNIIKCKSHDITIFVIPQGNALPLHDHPGMMVATKLLHGSLQITSFDETRDGLYSSSTEIKSDLDDSWILTPTIGNLHQFRAITTCVILDILTPPYDETENRMCTFYKPKINGSLWKLEARSPSWMPNDDQVVYNGDSQYRGVRVTM